MSKKEKLVQKIRNNPKTVSFEDLDSVLTWYGFVKRSSSSGTSHVYYTLGVYQISVPYRRPHVKATYVRQVLDILDQIDEEQELL
jgi:hypothetical protein